MTSTPHVTLDDVKTTSTKRVEGTLSGHTYETGLRKMIIR
jgi:hypothetical protein